MWILLLALERKKEGWEPKTINDEINIKRISQ
jgi:hypothetical protein